MQKAGLDFETYGSVDLRKHGLDRYISDEYFTPLIASGWTGNKSQPWRFDFVDDFDRARRVLADFATTYQLVVHNASFEDAVLDWLDIKPAAPLIDSAVIARANGASGHLAGAAPQLLGVDKLKEGMDLIKLFSVPGPYQERNGSLAFDPLIFKDHLVAVENFKHYCDVDAELGFKIDNLYGHNLPAQEYRFAELTLKMNKLGWPVDVKSVQEMQRRYQENLKSELEQFRIDCDAKDLNLNSLKQLKEWALERGIKARSFDQKHCESLLNRIQRKLESPLLDKVKQQGYQDVERMLQAKLALGGSSLKKLPVILDTVGNDGRLRDQYMHYGAGQSGRTTGRSVQMQNLKRLGELSINMDDLHSNGSYFDNAALAENIRQVFTSKDVNGSLLVGDFASVESRGLAWLAREEWKLDAYRLKRDIYKVQAGKIYGVTYEDVTKPQRQVGKVGELSCGYGAGGPAVMEFAKNMGVDMSEAEAGKLVRDWREANPYIVDFWTRLDNMLHEVVRNKGGAISWRLPDDFELVLRKILTPSSLMLQARQGAVSLEMVVYDSNRNTFMRRVFLGLHEAGRNVRYYKPSDRKTGDLWKDHYIDPKTGQVRHYELYGGKLAGILTQSFCRELFFRSLEDVCQWADKHDDLEVVGQFHDEIVVDWVPVGHEADLGHRVKQLEQKMSDPGLAASFPLAAEVKYAYRYIK